MADHGNETGILKCHDSVPASIALHGESDRCGELPSGPGTVLQVQGADVIGYDSSHSFLVWEGIVCIPHRDAREWFGISTAGKSMPYEIAYLFIYRSGGSRLPPRVSVHRKSRSGTGRPQRVWQVSAQPLGSSGGGQQPAIGSVIPGPIADQVQLPATCSWLPSPPSVGWLCPPWSVISKSEYRVPKLTNVDFYHRHKPITTLRCLFYRSTSPLLLLLLLHTPTTTHHVQTRSQPRIGLGLCCPQGMSLRQIDPAAQTVKTVNLKLICLCPLLHRLPPPPDFPASLNNKGERSASTNTSRPTSSNR